MFVSREAGPALFVHSPVDPHSADLWCLWKVEALPCTRSLPPAPPSSAGVSVLARDSASFDVCDDRFRRHPDSKNPDISQYPGRGPGGSVLVIHRRAGLMCSAGRKRERNSAVAVLHIQD